MQLCVVTRAKARKRSHHHHWRGAAGLLETQDSLTQLQHHSNVVTLLPKANIST